MDVYSSEDEQVEELKKWWAENGRSVFLGLVLGLGAIFGWRGWQSHEAAQAEAASALYEQMIVAARSGDKEVNDLAAQLIESHESSPYSTFAHMLLAQQAVVARDLEEAEAQSRAALSSATDNVLRHELRLRLVRILAAREKFDDALALLDQKDKGEFAAAYDELQGDLLASRGDSTAARAAYEQALVRHQSTGRNTAILESKLDDLGRTDRS